MQREKIVNIVESLMVRSMALEILMDSNVVSRFDVEHMCSKVQVWLDEKFKGDHVKMWNAFADGRRPL